MMGLCKLPKFPQAAEPGHRVTDTVLVRYRGTHSSYKLGSIVTPDLVEAIPELATLADIEAVEFSQVGSSNITSQQLIQLAKQVDEKLNADPAGVVISPGSDTLEEIACCLDMTVRSPKPVVLVGAMRPSGVLGVEGPRNLFAAVSLLAVCTESRNRGALVVMSDRICSGYNATEMDANNVNTLGAGDAGYIGRYDEGELNFSTSQHGRWSITFR